ncbi:unnamed protein product [Trifolium pratense]|uniref:Uncharacterized protein n=1 Tax=Trifolium pratense TaxID=57577 RepID=A0ACB0LF69_TRIPR|nr:unnamed protein product [Trifolium pratense]
MFLSSYLTESEYGLMLGDELVTDREINTSKRWNIECDGPMERDQSREVRDYICMS